MEWQENLVVHQLVIAVNEHMLIRALSPSDWNSVQKIYAEGLATKIATFETQVPTWEQWNDKFLPTCRLVTEVENQVIGFAVLSAVSKRKVYQGVAEVTIYIASSHHGKGIGKELLKELISCSEKNGFWTLQAGIFPQNLASIKLHESCGFRILGTREKVAQRDDVWHDNIIMERRSKKIGIQ